MHFFLEKTKHLLNTQNLTKYLKSLVFDELKGNTVFIVPVIFKTLDAKNWIMGGSGGISEESIIRIISF